MSTESHTCVGDNTLASNSPTDAASMPAEQTAVNGESELQAQHPVDTELHGLPPLRIVGIGASAGGLEALRVLVRTLPHGVNACYAIAQHLSPAHRSMLVELLARECSLAVVEIVDQQTPTADTIYVTPSSHHLQLRSGRFTLIPATRPGIPKPSIDDFFESLAQQDETRSIGIILSGTGSDGARGVRHIHEYGGHTLVQEPSDARYDGMPRAAIETGCVDFVGTIGQIAERLGELLNSDDAIADGNSADSEKMTVVEQIVQTVKRRSGFDLGQYKLRSLNRRIQRRVVASGAASIEAYAELLNSGGAAEVERLVREMFISVTQFFRDTEVFEALSIALSARLEQDNNLNEFRVWIPGCATGEEAYSIAMLLNEHCEQMQRWPVLRIFATDVDASALATARKGTYPIHALNHVPPALAEKYMLAEGAICQVTKRIRDSVIFSEHNVLRDPSFLRLDLISCRNLIMYLVPDVQKRLISSFAHALKPDGLLLLGKAESLHEGTHYFHALAQGAQLYRSNGPVRLPREARKRNLDSPEPALGRVSAESRNRDMGQWLARAHAEGVLPPFVMVDDNAHLLHVFGDVSPYLRVGAGNATLDLLRLANESIRLELRSLLLKAQRETHTKVIVDCPLDTQGAFTRLTGVRRNESGMPPMTLIMFESREGHSVATGEHALAYDQQRVALEDQLTATREHLSAVINELESANEELQSLNEELQSSNEELQSTNEELETSNEELQSTNEELITVNEELEARTLELASRNADLHNVKNSLVDPIIVVDEYRRVTLFNPPATRIFALDASAVGQLLFSLPCLIELGDTASQIANVLDRHAIVERQLTGERSYLMRIQPYLNLSGKCRGAVLTFHDNTELLGTTQDLADANDQILRSERFLASTLDALPQAIGVIDREGKVLSCNLRWTALETQQAGLDALCPIGQNLLNKLEFSQVPGRAELLVLLEGIRQVMHGQKPRFESEIQPGGTGSALVLLASVVPFINGAHWVISLKDISDRKHAQATMDLQAKAMDASLTAITIADATLPDQPLIYVNQAFEEITGYSAAEVIGRNCRFLQGNDREQEGRYAIQKALSSMSKVRTLLRNYRKSGELFWNEVTIAPIIENGRVTHIVGLQRDMTNLLAKEQQLLSSLERESQALAFAGLGGIEFDIRAKRISITQQHSRLLGLSSDSSELSLTQYRKLICKEDLEAFDSALKLCISGHELLDVEYRVQWPDGSRHWLHTRGNIPISEDVPQHIIALSQDISSRKDAEDQVRYIAHHDALTGLPNRSLFRDRAQLAIKSAKRNRTRLAIMFIDLDHFKEINDSLGHEIGDTLLISVADRMRGSIRESDTVCRQSGDEFIALLPGIHDANDAAHIANKIIERIAKPHTLTHQELKVTCSAGIAMYPDDGDNLDDLMRHADTAMYHAKGRGRNHVEFFSQQLNQAHRDRAQIASALHHAIERGELRLHYQPQFDINKGTLNGIEALLRWQHPERGLLTPEAFIGVAEDSELINEIGDWVLREACRQARAWQIKGLPKVPMAVNVSPAQLRHKNILQKVSAALHDANLDPELLELELTERAIIHNPQSTGELLADLRREGVRLALDDFGTGYSSLSYLHRFPVDKLKIDRSFVATCPSDGSASAIVRAVINLAQSMDLEIVAEGVETKEQLAFLRHEGCAFFQGYLSAPGVPPEEFESAVEHYQELATSE